MTTINKSVRTAYIVPVFTCLASVFKLQVLTYDDNTNLFTCTGETDTVDMELFRAMCHTIDPDMSVNIKNNGKVVCVNPK